MESIFNVIDIWLNIIPYVDYRTFNIIKKLNKAIYRECYVKRKPLIEDLKNWEFNVKYIANLNKPTKNNSEWKQIKHKKGKSNTYQTDMTFIKRVKELDYDCLRNFMASYLPYGYDNNNLKYCLSMLIPGDTIDIIIEDENHRYPYRFYYDGTGFIKMNYIIDFGKYNSRYNKKEFDWEDYWVHKYESVYVYPEHVLNIVYYDLKTFFQKGKYLIHVSELYNLDYTNNWYSHSKGFYGPCHIGMHKSLKHCERRSRIFENILINDHITLKTTSENPIYAIDVKN